MTLKEAKKAAEFLWAQASCSEVVEGWYPRWYASRLAPYLPAWQQTLHRPCTRKDGWTKMALKGWLETFLRPLKLMLPLEKRTLSAAQDTG
jgi:hypothetical protein